MTYDDLLGASEELEARASEELVKVISDYRAVFGTEAGGRVLRDILRDHFVFELAKKPEHVVLQQQGTLMLRKLGVLERGREADAVDTLLRGDGM